MLEEEVKSTLPPSQKVIGPLAVIVGVAGKGFTVIVVPAELGETQDPLFTITE